MKKLTSPFILSIAFISIMLIYSCKKDIKHFFDGNEQSVQWAKDYYENNLQINQNYKLNLTASADKSISVKNTRLTNEKKPHWEESKAGVTPYYDYVELPLTYTHKITHTFGINQNPNVIPTPNQKIIDASFDRLIIYKDKKGKINQRIISFIPDEAYLTKHKNNINHNRIDKLDHDFVGYLHYKDWDGKALFVLRIVNGKPVKKYDMLKSTTGKITSSNTTKTGGGKVMVVDVGGGSPDQKCYNVSWDWYQDCYYTSPESEFPYYCDPVVVYNVQYVETPCPPGNGTGDGGGGPSPEDPEPCLGVLIFATGECILDEIVPTPIDTVNNITDSCLRALVVSLLNSEVKSQFQTLMHDFLLGDDHLIITFKDEDFGDEDAAGEMPGLVPKIINGEDYLLGTLYLNTRVLAGASQEYKTAVIYHEILHAYFHKLGGLFNGVHHAAMASSYTNMLKNVLMARFPNLSAVNASALAWNGLHDTVMWDLRPDASQIDYLNIEYSYTKHGTAGSRCN